MRRNEPHRPLRPVGSFLLIFFFTTTIASHRPQMYLVCRNPDTELCLSWPIKHDEAMQLSRRVVPGSDLTRLCGFSNLTLISPLQRVITVKRIQHNLVGRKINCDLSKVIVMHPYSVGKFEKEIDNLHRERRQAIYTPRGRYRGQTQSQYLAIDRGNGTDEGKAEAHSAADSSRASVSGNSGMGQAQSQTMYDPTCDDCVRRPEFEAESLRRTPNGESGGMSGTGPGRNGGYGPNQNSNGEFGPHRNAHVPVGAQSGLGNYGPGQNKGSSNGGGVPDTFGGVSGYRPGQGGIVPGAGSSYGPNQGGRTGYGSNQEGILDSGGSNGPNGGSYGPHQGGVSEYGPGNYRGTPGAGGSYGNGQGRALGGSEPYGNSQDGVPGGGGVYGPGQTTPNSHGTSLVGELGPGGRSNWPGQDVTSGSGAYVPGQGRETYALRQGGVPSGVGSYGNGQGAPGSGSPNELGLGGGSYIPTQGGAPGGGATYIPSQGGLLYGPNHGQAPSTGESYRPGQGGGSYGPSPGSTPGVGGYGTGPNGGTVSYGPGQGSRVYNPSQGGPLNTGYGIGSMPSGTGSFGPGPTGSGGGGGSQYVPNQSGISSGGPGREGHGGSILPGGGEYGLGQGNMPSGTGTYGTPGSGGIIPDSSKWPITTGSFPTASGPAYYCCVVGPNNNHQLFAVGGSGLQPHGNGNSQGSQVIPGQYFSGQGPIPNSPYGTGSSSVPNNLMGPAYGTGNTGGANGVPSVQSNGPGQGAGSGISAPNGQLGPGLSYGNGITGANNGQPTPGGYYGGAGGPNGQNSLPGPGGQYGGGPSSGTNGLTGLNGPYGPGGRNDLSGNGGTYNTGSSGSKNGVPGPGQSYGLGSTSGPNGLSGTGGPYSSIPSGGQNGLESGPGSQYAPGFNSGQNGFSGGPYNTGPAVGQNEISGPGGQFGSVPSSTQNGVPGSGGPYTAGSTGGQNGVSGPTGQYGPGSTGGHGDLPAGPYNTGSTGGQIGPGRHYAPDPTGGQNGLSGTGGPYNTGSTGVQNGIAGPGGQFAPTNGGQNGLSGIGGPYNAGGLNGIPGPGGKYASGPTSGSNVQPGLSGQHGSGNEPNNLMGSSIPYGNKDGPGGLYGNGANGGPNGRYGPGGVTGPYSNGGTGSPFGTGGQNALGPYGSTSGSNGVPNTNNNYGPGGQSSTGVYGSGPSGGQNGLTGPYGNEMPSQGGATGQYGLNGVDNQGNAGQVSEFGSSPQNFVDPNSISDGDDSEAEASVNQAVNGTIATAASKGGNDKGRAQTHVHGAYTGSGSFSAQAEISGENKGANSEVTGDKKGASSSAQGTGRNNKSQANVQLGSETGSVLTGSQSEGSMHSSNTQVQGSIKGGMADAQARGPGSTSSQAQIGFTPYKGDKLHEAQKSPFLGGGTASAQSSGRTGTSQSQLHGTFKYGITYNGAAQAGASIDKDAVFPNRLPFDKIDVYDESNKNIDVNDDNTEIPEVAAENFSTSTYLPSDIDTENLTTEKPEEETLRTPENDFDEQSDHKHSDHHKTDLDILSPTLSPPVESRRSFPVAYNPVPPDYEFTTDKDDVAQDEYDVDDGFGPDGNDPPEVEQTDYNEFSRDTEATHQSLHSPNRKGIEVRQTTGGNTQHILLGSLTGHDAKITQKTSERPDESRVYQPGERIPGTGGYTIPIGFTGSVKSVASKDETYAIGSKDYPSQAQTVSLTPGSGKIKYTHPYSYGKNVNQKDLRSLYNSKNDDNNRYVSVSKSVTRSLDGENNIRKQYSHTYYTKSSSCGYFTFTCTMVSGSEGRKKVCKPKIPTNPDGTPMRC